VLLAQIRGLEDQPAQVASRILSRASSARAATVCRRAGTRRPSRGSRRRASLERFRETYAADRLVLAVSGAVDRRRGAGRGGAALRGLRPAGRAPRDPRPPTGPCGSARPRRRRRSRPRAARLPRAARGASDHVRAQGRQRRPGRRDVEPAVPDAPGRGRPRVLGGVLLSHAPRGGPRRAPHREPRPENVAAAEAGLRREAERLAGEPVDEEELDRTKAYLSDRSCWTAARTGARASTWRSTR
jgi:hypothetical protein